MRQSNQKSRSRGRSRKPQNNMSRNFESNGPDVKIRGNAAHIAEKYTTLAGDCLSNGDRVIAENYLQHAEHYNRIVAAAQQQVDERAAEMAARNPQPENTQPDVENQNVGNQEAIRSNDAEEVNTAANGKAEINNENVEAAPKERKNTRTRRPRKPVVANVSENTNDALAKSTEPAVNVEVISDDAAKLPGSLLGGMAAEEG